MKMTLKMQKANFELEFDDMKEACEFINMFIRNNPSASLINMEDIEKRIMLNEAATAAAEILGVDKADPLLKAAIEAAGELIGLSNGNKVL